MLGMDQRKRTGSGGSGPLTYPKFPTATKFCPYCNFPLGTYNERKAHMLNHKDKQVSGIKFAFNIICNVLLFNSMITGAVITKLSYKLIYEHHPHFPLNAIP